MNKYQEALDYLAVSLQVFDETVDDKPYRDELDSKRETARKELQGLVDKAIPHKLLKNGLCKCGARVIVSFQDYCTQCGQAIDWSNE